MEELLLSLRGSPDENLAKDCPRQDGQLGTTIPQDLPAVPEGSTSLNDTLEVGERYKLLTRCTVRFLEFLFFQEDLQRLSVRGPCCVR